MKCAEDVLPLLRFERNGRWRLGGPMSSLLEWPLLEESWPVPGPFEEKEAAP